LPRNNSRYCRTASADVPPRRAGGLPPRRRPRCWQRRWKPRRGGSADRCLAPRGAAVPGTRVAASTLEVCAAASIASVRASGSSGTASRMRRTAARTRSGCPRERQYSACSNKAATAGGWVPLGGDAAWSDTDGPGGPGLGGAAGTHSETRRSGCAGLRRRGSAAGQAQIHWSSLRGRQGSGRRLRPPGRLPGRDGQDGHGRLRPHGICRSAGAGKIQSTGPSPCAANCAGATSPANRMAWLYLIAARAWSRHATGRRPGARRVR
jgi:hypothetical protein